VINPVRVLDRKAFTDARNSDHPEYYREEDSPLLLPGGASSYVTPRTCPPAMRE